MQIVKRKAALKTFGRSYEVDCGASLPHFGYSGITSAKTLDEIAARWLERPAGTKKVKVYECLGSRPLLAGEGWNKFFSDIFMHADGISDIHLTTAVADHAAGEFEMARRVLTGFPYRQRSFFNKLFGAVSTTELSMSHRLFSDIIVAILPLPEEIYLTDHFLFPGDKVFHLIDHDIQKGTKIVDYVIRDRYVVAESRHRYIVKYTAFTEGCTMPLHFELRNNEIFMASYGDCTSPCALGPLFLTLEQARRTEAAVWERVGARLGEFSGATR